VNSGARSRRPALHARLHRAPPLPLPGELPAPHNRRTLRPLVISVIFFYISFFPVVLDAIETTYFLFIVLIADRGREFLFSRYF